MERQKLNFRFHNPNTAEATAEYILKIFIEANKEKVEQAIQAAAEATATAQACFDKLEISESHSA